MTALDQPSRALAGGFHHLLRLHARIAQEAGKAHLPGTVAAHTAYADAKLANTNQSGQKAGPPFSRRRSPNRPKLTPIRYSPNPRGAPIDSDKYIRRKSYIRRCVHMVGSSPRMTWKMERL